MAGNPAFSNTPAFSSDPRQSTQFGQQQYGQQAYGQQPYSQTPLAPQQGYATPDQLEAQFDRPSASPLDTGRLTYDGVIMKTVVTLGATAAGFVITLGLFLAGSTGLSYLLTFGGAIVGFVLALVNIFKKEPSRVLVLGYGFAQGLFLGGFSAQLEFMGVAGEPLAGIIFQALLATACVFGVTLAGYAFRVFRTSPRANKIFFIAIIGYMVFSLANFGMMLFGATGDLAFGMRSAPSPLFGIPWGVLLGLFAVALGAYSLVMDFESIETGVKNGVPAKYGWKAAFGITLTIIWLYVEIIRVIAILRSNN